MVQTTSSGADAPLLEACAVWKFFGSNAVLKGIDLTLMPGQVHALLGGNGAGKSTLMKIIAGLYVADRGEVRIRGQQTTLNTPTAAHQHGIYLVPQEPMLFPNLSVEENILMHMPEERSKLRTRLQKLIGELGTPLDLSVPAGQLEVADQQVVEILRGLVREARILILDEPTSALTPHEVTRLFDRIHALSTQKVGIFFISHKLGEIRAIAEVVSFMRDGKIALAGPPSDFTDTQIVRAMTQVDGGDKKNTGENDTSVLGTASKARSDGAEVLRVDRLCGEGFANVSFSLHAGEILGLAGVVGSGRTELAETLYGLRPAARGSVFMDGQSIALTSPRASLDRGIIYLPEDRQSSGLFVEASLVWNTTSLILYREPFWLSRTAEQARFDAYVTQLGIVCRTGDQAARTLSGGNQQKILLAKCLAADPRVLILDEPTRGVDVAVRADIYRQIDDLAARGMAILLISSDHEEVVRLSHRVLVMDHGFPGGALSGDAITVDTIAQLSFGIHGTQETAP